MKPVDVEISQSLSIKDSSQSLTPGKLEVKRRLGAVGQGAVGAFIATSICCLLPAVAIAIGLTGSLAATLMNLGRFRFYGVLAGLVFVVIISWFSLRRSRVCCTKEEYKRRRITIPLTILVSFGVGYTLIMYLMLPMLYKLG